MTTKHTAHKDNQNEGAKQVRRQQDQAQTSQGPIRGFLPNPSKKSNSEWGLSHYCHNLESANCSLTSARSNAFTS